MIVHLFYPPQTSYSLNWANLYKILSFFCQSYFSSFLLNWIWGLCLKLVKEIEWQEYYGYLQNAIKPWDGGQEPWQAETWNQGKDYIGATLVPSKCCFNFLLSAILVVLARTGCFQHKSKSQSEFIMRLNLFVFELVWYLAIRVISFTPLMLFQMFQGLWGVTLLIQSWP